jgi:hypothetical protein
MKSMALNKMMAMSDEVVANVGYSNKGLAEKPSEPKYPYCLRLYLSQSELDMLGLKELPSIGSKMSMEATVMVVGQRLDEGAKTMEIQIIEMELESDSDKKLKDPSEALYGESETEDED